MTDKELLELAAKAAGIVLLRWNEMYRSYETNEGFFNPIMNDGDAHRLETKLSLHVHWYSDAVVVGHQHAVYELFNNHGGDKAKARRYAGIRSAAEIGQLLDSDSCLDKTHNI